MYTYEHAGRWYGAEMENSTVPDAARAGTDGCLHETARLSKLTPRWHQADGARDGVVPAVAQPFNQQRACQVPTGTCTPVPVTRSQLRQRRLRGQYGNFYAGDKDVR